MIVEKKGVSTWHECRLDMLKERIHEADWKDKRFKGFPVECKGWKGIEDGNV